MTAYRWIPALILTTGFVATMRVADQPAQPLRVTLASVSAPGMSLLSATDSGSIATPASSTPAGEEYSLWRAHSDGDLDAPEAEIHVCYTPRLGPEKWDAPAGLCGIEPWWSVVRVETLPAGGGEIGPASVRRYHLRSDRDDTGAIAVIWHQGRGRIEGSPFRARITRAWDSIVRRRSEEALVRVQLPMAPGVSLEDAESSAMALAEQAMSMLGPALPAER